MDRNDLILQSYFNQIKQIPLLSFETELELSRRIQKGDETARCALIEANLRLVVKIAKAYLTSGIALMDIIQEGNMGLMKAVDKYDHAKNVRFSTYAGWWIRQAVSRFISNKRRTIRLPHRKEEMFRKIQRAYHVLSQIYMRQPKIEEIAVEIGVPLDDVEFILNMTNSFVTLPADGGDEDYSGFVDIHEDYTYNPERAFIRKSSRDATLRVLNRLKDRERRILIYRYQINGCERHTLKTIGDKMGLSPETVRQIEIKALQKIRNENEDLRFYYMEAI
ncbi:MAG: RNA polymerase sigma factor RpoD/SigA [Treponema sp.]|jgi:RNA polymerase primary sigma factor|nr:RNA polymerase sigma factor RpoD/SigA [Treponema sp.]